MTGRPSAFRLFRDIATAPRDGTTIEVKHGMHQEIVRAAWDDQKQAFIREDDADHRTLHRVTEWRPVMGGAVIAGTITLADIAGHLVMLDIACKRCDRAGGLSVDRLVQQHGAAFGIPELLQMLTSTCVNRTSISVYDLCGVHCPQLPGLYFPRDI